MLVKQMPRIVSDSILCFLVNSNTARNSERNIPIVKIVLIVIIIT